MYTPTFNTNARSLPILSRAEIDQIGESLVADFNPDAVKEPTEIDIDRFITRYLGMEQDFQYLSHCGLYLGMTVFNDSDRVTVFNPDKWCAEFISAKAGTVIIDNSLLADNQEHRYRFTAGHEAAHGVLHTEYFAQLAKKNASAVDIMPMVQCRADSTRVHKNTSRMRTDADWMEWQANSLSSSILMPVVWLSRRLRGLSERVTAQTPHWKPLFGSSMFPMTLRTIACRSWASFHRRIKVIDNSRHFSGIIPLIFLPVMLAVRLTPYDIIHIAMHNQKTQRYKLR